MGKENIEGGSEKCERPERGGSEKLLGLGGGGLRKFVYLKTKRRRRGLLKNLTASEGG